MKATSLAWIVMPLTGWMILAASPADAQCSFDSSAPSWGEILKQVPDSFTLNFLFGIELQNVRVVGDDGRVWPTDWTRAENDVFKAEFHVTQGLPPGKYQLEWTAYVRQHYHSDGGSIPFTIAANDGAGATADATPAAAPPAAVAPPVAMGWPYRGLRGVSAPPTGR